MEDFTYLITVDDTAIRVREICPKDFYFAQVLRQSERSQIELILRLILTPEALKFISSRNSRKIFRWISHNLLSQSILTVENWLEVAYHLCKQRWDSSVDWLEAQPMSKINAMVEIVRNHAEEQEKQMKKAQRKK